MRRLMALIAVCCAAIGLAACGSSGSVGAGSSTADSVTSRTPISLTPDGNITVYSGQHEQTVKSLVSAFEAKTHIKVKVRNDDEAVLAQQIIQEGSRTPADVFFAGNSPALDALDAKGLLAHTAPQTLAAVAPESSPTSGDWVGVTARATVLAYNTTKIQTSDLPSTVLDLSKPMWKGKLGIAPSETDFQPLVTAIMQLKGLPTTTAWLKGIKANGKIYPDNEALVAAINRGDVQAGVINHYYLFRLRDEIGASKIHTALHYFPAGDAGSIVNISGAGQLAASHHPGSAQAFLAFLVSKQGQEIIARSESYEYPLGSGVQTAKDLRPFKDFGTPVLTIAQLGNGQQALKLMQQVGLL